MDNTIVGQYIVHQATCLNKVNKKTIICDWILENQSKLHIRSFEISYYNLPMEVSMRMKCTHNMHQFITFQITFTTCGCLYWVQNGDWSPEMKL